MRFQTLSSCSQSFGGSPPGPAAPACSKAPTTPLPYHSGHVCPFFIPSRLAHLSSVQNKGFQYCVQARKEGDGMACHASRLSNQPVDVHALCGAMISRELCKYSSRIVQQMNGTADALQFTVDCRFPMMRGLIVIDVLHFQCSEDSFKHQQFQYLCPVPTQHLKWWPLAGAHKGWYRETVASIKIAAMPVSL